MKIKNTLKASTKHRIILTVIYIILVLLITRFKYAYGSCLDWCSQHYAFPDYFRKLFYDTGELFPDFAANIGAGQNIYNFSYYGLFSPIIMLSYIFPFIKMHIYIQLISIIEVWVSIMLFYNFLNKRFSLFAAFSGSLAFIFSSAYIFHSHRHIMFVSYMPFLILSLEAADKFVKKSFKTPLIICMLLMILCNYYFSIPSIISVSVYAVYSYLKNNKKFDLKDFTLKGLNFALCVITAILVSSVLLLPSFSTIFNGRENQAFSFDYTALIPHLIPGLSVIFPQTMGITVFGIIAIVSSIVSGAKSSRFMGIFIAVINFFPVFVLILNGGMYFDGKVYIPFIPLFTLIVTEKFEEYKTDFKEKKSVLIISGIIIIESVVLYQKKYDFAKYVPLLVLGIDCLAFIVFIFIFYQTRDKVHNSQQSYLVRRQNSMMKPFNTDHAKSKVRRSRLLSAVKLKMSIIILYAQKKRNCFLVLSAIFTSAIVTVFSGIFDTLMPIERIQYENSDEIKQMADIIAADRELTRSSLNARKADTVNLIYNMDYYSPGVYSSICNNFYKDFYFNIIRNENEYRNSALITYSGNILFNIFMGNKYLISNKNEAETGYELLEKGTQFNLYENNYALPIGRSSDMIISKSYFDKLTPIEQMEAVINYIIVDDDSISNECVFSNRKYTFPTIPEVKGLKRNKNSYSIKSSVQFETDIKLDSPLLKDELMFISMDIENLSPDKDARIKINNVRNTNTCSSWKYRNNNNRFEYILSTNGSESLEKLHFIFSDGEYSIKNIECYTINYPKNIDLTGEFHADKALTKGDIVSGSINCEKDSFFELTIPYDNGFVITVDGLPQEYQLVDKAFIGFKIKKGEHSIKIEYKAPLKKEGSILSLSGIIILLAIAAYEIFCSLRNKRYMKKSLA